MVHVACHTFWTDVHYSETEPFGCSNREVTDALPVSWSIRAALDAETGRWESVIAGKFFELSFSLSLPERVRMGAAHGAGGFCGKL